MPRDIFEEQGINPNNKAPVDIFQAEGIQPPQQTTNQSLINRLANSAPVNFTLGAGDALQNTLANVGNLIPGVNIPLAKSADGTAYNIGKFAGNTAAFLGGGEGLEAARAGAEAIPLAGKLAQAFAGNGIRGVARRAVGSGIYGAVTNPGDRLRSGAEGAGLSMAADALPGTLGLAGKLTGSIANAFRPQKYAQQILDTLGSGKSLQENAKSLAQDIKGGYEKAADNAAKEYAPVFDTLGDKPLYENSANSAYRTLDKNSLNYDRNLNKVHQEFTDNPTLQNAHNLQSQLGTAIRKLQKSDAKGNLSVADRSTLQGYQEAQGAIKNDINNFLISKNPALADQYQVANTNYATNVVPYLETPGIASIAKGEITNPKNISSIFKKPEPEIQKIVEDLGVGANNKILYSEIGKLKPNLSPENLTKAFSKLENQGLDSYVTPDLSAQLETLTRKTMRRDLAQRGVGFLTGAALGHGAGIPLGEAVGAGAGAFLSPMAAKAAQKINIPINKEALANAIAKSYGVGSKALIANAINKGQS